MIRHTGFTIIELTITITVMGILLALTVINLNGTQANGRDAERKNDTLALQSNLEAYYKVGVTGSSTVNKYPSTELNASGDTSLASFLPDMDPAAAIAPGSSTVAASFLAATNNNQATGSVTPQPTTGQYVYQPLQADGSLCTLESQECRKFNIFYHLETDNTVYKVTSNHQ